MNITKEEFDQGVAVITPMLSFNWSCLDEPDYGDGKHFAKRPEGKGSYYVNVAIDPSESNSGWSVNGEKQTSGQAGFLAFLKELDTLSNDIAAAKSGEEVPKGPSVKLSKNDDRKAAGIFDSRFSMTETTGKGMAQRPTLAEANGQPTTHPQGMLVSTGRCSLTLFPALQSGMSRVTKYLKAVQVTGWRSGGGGGSDFDAVDPADSNVGSGASEGVPF